MSEVITKKFAAAPRVECVLAQTDCYIETLRIQAIDAQPGLLELVIRTQLLSAKKPSEKRVKSRTCIERSKLLELHQGIDRFLQATGGSSGQPSNGVFYDYYHWWPCPRLTHPLTEAVKQTFFPGLPASFSRTSSG